MKVKGKTTVPGGRYRGTDADGKAVRWSDTEERTIDLSDEGYWACKDDPAIVMVDVDNAAPERPKAQSMLQTGAAPTGASNIDPHVLGQAIALALAQAQGGGGGVAPQGQMSPQAAAALAQAQGANAAAGTGGTATKTIPQDGGTGPSVAPAGAGPLTAKNPGK